MFLVGLFRTEEEAREMTGALDELRVENERDSILLAEGDEPRTRHRVRVVWPADLSLREHFVELPLERWPSWIELVKSSLSRLRELDPNGVRTGRIRLRPPLGETRVRELEERSNITLPAAYRTFVAEIGNGGEFHVTWLSELEEVLSSCSLSSWREPLVADTLCASSPDEEPPLIEGAAEGPWPGLLRISGASYGGMITHVSKDGRAFLCVPAHDEEGRVYWENLGDWARHVWIGLANDIEPFARTLAWMKMGAKIEVLENGLGGRNATREHKDAVIGGLLGTGAEVPEGALAEWRARRRG